MLQPLAIRHYLNVMSSKGFDAGAVLADTGVTVADVENAGFLIEFNHYRRIIENMVGLCGDDCLGLDVSEKSDISWFGVAGHASLCCNSLRDCIDRIRGPYGPLLGFVNGFSLGERVGDAQVVHIVTASSDGPFHRFCVEEALGTLFKLGGQMTGELPKFKKIQVDYPKGRYGARYTKMFGCPVEFGAHRSQVLLTTKWVDQPLPQRDEEMAQFYQEHLLEIVRRIKNCSPVKSQVCDLLLRRCHQLPSLDQTAQELGMTSRTLSRHLQQEGVTYRVLVEEVRSTLAKEYIRSGRFPPKQISDTLGFEDVNAFRRAFKSWTGLTIRQYRRTTGVAMPEGPSRLVQGNQSGALLVL